jgi:hypothetical protein
MQTRAHKLTSEMRLNKQKENADSPKTTLPLKTSGVVKQIPVVERDADTSAESIPDEASAENRTLPYVDVTPVRSVERSVAIRQGSPVNVTELPKAEPTYRSRAPVETGLDVEKIVDNVLDLEITIPLRNLAGVSNAIQKEIRKQVTKTRQIVDEPKKVHWAVDEAQNFTSVDSLPVPTFMTMEDVTDEIPEGHLVASDPVLQYLSDNKEADAQRLVVALPSEPLRAVYATVNGIDQEECLLDSGSMIVSMAKEVAVQTGLSWDPSVRINMESASNHVEKTLGVARNVCFRMGGLDLFLQVHILENPPYRVLLGRPFDVFTNSVVKTTSDGSTEIMITDPNTKKVAMLPAYQRGVGPQELTKQRYQSF